MSAVSPVRQKSSQLEWQVVLAFLAIYVLWGSTYLAIRIAVATVPPFFAAGTRFVLAGIILLIYSVLRGVALPSALEWRNLIISAALLFVPSYAGLFWAEKTMPSGIASAIVATIPVWMALFEVFILKQLRLRWQLAVSIICGFCGVSILTLRGTEGGARSLLPYVVMVVVQITWTVGTLLAKNRPMPSSKPLSAGIQMAVGGLVLLVLSAAAGELSPFPTITPRAAAAILYLTIAGSVIAFTAYLWLLDRMSATTVSSYAYVNPLVALALGAWLGNEVLDLRILLGAFLIVAGVVLSLKFKHQAPD